MAKLSNTHKTFIITSLACQKSPSDIQALLKEKYGIDVKYNQLSFYNVDALSSAGLGDQWRELYYKTREKFLNSLNDIPLSHKAYRLNILQRNLDDAMKNKNIVLANQIIEQASKEMKVIEEQNMNDDPNKNRKKNIFEYLKEINQRIVDSGVLNDKNPCVSGSIPPGHTQN